MFIACILLPIYHDLPPAIFSPQLCCWNLTPVFRGSIVTLFLELQPQRQSSRGRQRTVTPPKHRSAAPTTRVQTEEQPSPASTESSSENEADAIEVLKPSQPPPVAAPAAGAAALNAQKATPTEAFVQTTKASSSSETQVVQIDQVPSLDNQGASPVEIVMEEAVRITRARSRKTRLAPNP